MKKMILISIVFVVCFVAGFNIFLKNIENTTMLTMFNIDNIAYGEIITVEAKDNTDNPKSCKTTKLVEVSIGNGKFEYKEIGVTGMENACKSKENQTCTSYACYSNS